MSILSCPSRMLQTYRPGRLNRLKPMYGMGIIMGTAKEGKVYFNPMGAISRQEVMTIIGRTQQRGYAEADLTKFADYGQVADWALPYVKTLVQQQVVSGYDGKVWPKRPGDPGTGGYHHYRLVLGSRK